MTGKRLSSGEWIGAIGLTLAATFAGIVVGTFLLLLGCAAAIAVAAGFVLATACELIARFLTACADEPALALFPVILGFIVWLVYVASQGVP